MEKAFKKFCQQIDFKISPNLIDSKINNVVFDDSKNKSVTIFDVSFFSIPTELELKDFYHKSTNFFNPTELKFKLSFINKNYSVSRIMDIFSFAADVIYQKNIRKYIREDFLTFDVSNKILKIEFESIIDQNEFDKLFSLNLIKDFLNINELKIEINSKKKIDIFDDEVDQEFIDMIKAKKALKENDTNRITNKDNKYNLINAFKNKKFFKVTMSEFHMTQEKFLLVEGEIFNVEKLVTKTNLIIMSIYVTDGTEALIAKYFVREGDKDINSWIKIGMKVSIIGEKKQEYNSQSSFLQINKITEIIEEKIKDNSKEKRIEFSARSSMSSMDGFISAVDMMKYAKNIGHEAIAFVDFQNIQAFPDIYNNAKNIGIKPIYGCTFSTISKQHNLIWNTKKNSLLKDEKYIIFDLETTSLNPRHGEIIEFGAVIVENLKIKDTIQFFIKPSNPISKFTEELTGISQKLIDSESKFDNQKDAILKIINIFNEDYTLVAHNAQFDIGFIKEKIKQFNLPEIKNQVIDTLGIARYLFPISMSYRLEAVCKKLNIIYDPTVAHRADYDANVLEQVWISMIELLDRKNIKSFEDINKIDDPILNNKKMPHDIAIYAKNQKGIKELFNLVSISLTKNYFDGPRLFVEDLDGYENLLIGPASINTKLMDLAQTGTSEELDNEIDKWDFIGIPSPHLFSHLIARGNFTKEELNKALKEIILKAKSKNKLVIAVGDVRYLTDSDSIAHLVYINTKGLEGRRHPLYRYNDNNPNYPIQKFLTTKEIKEQFDFLNSSDLIDEIVVKNTNYLNSLIDENIEIIKSKLYPPKFDDSDNKLQKLVYENAYKIYGSNLPKIVEDRIVKELEPINEYGFSVVYWISHKLVAKSLNDGYLVGSRGSVGSSIVATLSNITEVNPLPPHYICKKCQYNEFVDNPKTTSGFDLDDKKCPNCDKELHKNGQTIPFETFLGFNGDKVPDIDLNFSGDYQPIIHQEVRRLFGEERTFRAGTISTVASKTAFGFVKKYFEDQGINKTNIFVSYLAQKIEGSKRTTGQHPGGIIIIPKEFDVEDFTPINYPANDINSTWQTTHFDFHAIHDNVLKLDLLGHDDPTAIKLLQKLTKVKIEDISFSDKNVLKLFSSTEPLGVKPSDINNEQTGVLGIPEFGTRFVRKMLKVAKPMSFNDLINISGLSHGTNVWNDNAEDLIKNGKKLNEVISCRDDIMVYLMQKGIDPSSSFQIMEKVRKGKGLSADDEKLLKENGIESWYINSLNKIKYMFPKAHATAYVMMAWRIAWFKIYYPLEYYATFFTVRPDVFDIENSIGSKTQIEKKLKELESRQFSNGKDKLSQKEEYLIPIFEMINEMLARGISISNIDLKNSDATEWKINYETKSLIPPFIVLDGLGINAAKSITEARNEKWFTSKEDLMKRTQINKTSLEKLESLGVTSNLEHTDQIKLF
ncbi:MAG: PolC-type DNA polymerase III [Mycoplasma sp.]|nr:PolC-type DNA polymerase III [Mycoplasma sp.]